eukprot:CAMPEP_0171108714 /NCGR_PEP_ID=MMETSP0766_2-20121228/69466_1 /TAXON_ID=439317 /ORGANISM="Gambierdiscus australes, Strain CAWD 149" /LENGTH=554 /DNA_ID=CAMNT_0011570301 /DNA_START=39 /DNA_END=1703 /DNA_ORIENTATION=+
MAPNLLAMRLSAAAFLLQLAACQPNPALIQVPQGWPWPESAAALEQEARSVSAGLLQVPRNTTQADSIALSVDAGIGTLEASPSEVACNENWIARLLCMIILCCVFLLLTALVPSHYGIAEKACITQAAVLLITNLSFTVVIPSSYRMARVVGLGAAYSGLLIGLYQLGVCAGAVAMWVTLRFYPEAWRFSFPIMVGSTFVSLLGAALYFALSIAAEPFFSGVPVEHEKPWMAFPLVVSRLLDGFGTGVIVQMGQILIIHLVKSEDRASWMATNQFASMLGIGLGPMVSSVVSALNLCHSSTGQLAAVGIGYVGLALTSSVLALARFPRHLDEVIDQQPAPTTQVSSDEIKDARSRIVLVLGSLVMCLMRSFVISGLEAATSFLLEVEYDWGLAPTGIAVGLCFLFCIPVKLFFNTFQDQLSLICWIRLAGAGAVVGGVMLYRWSNSAYVLLVGDALVFPALFLGDALTAGIMMMSQHLMPLGSLFDANHVVLQRALFMCLGRNLGPPLARTTVQGSGQNGYATQQLVIAVLFLVVLEIWVVPNAKLEVHKAKQ